MNGKAQDEMLAEECGIGYDEVMADDNTLTAKEFIYECAKCKAHSPLDDFINTEYDGDIFGTCPKCGEHTMIFEVTSEDDVLFAN